MAFNDYADYLADAPNAPDFAQLADRLFLVDGINPNMVLGRLPEDTRPMGAVAQETELGLVQGNGGSLTPGTAYVYGVQRVVYKDGVALVPSAVTTETIDLAQSQSAYKLTCGAASPATIDGSNLWSECDQAYFKITVNSTAADIGPIDISLKATMASIAVALENAIQGEGGDFEDVTVEYDAGTGKFVFSAPTEIGYLEAVSGHDSTSHDGAGDDIDLAANTNHPHDGDGVITGGTHGDIVLPPVGDFELTALGVTKDVSFNDSGGEVGNKTEFAAFVQAAIRATDAAWTGIEVTYLGGDQFEVRIPNGAATFLTDTGAAPIDYSGETMINPPALDYGLDCSARVGSGAVITREEGNAAYTLLSGTAAAGATKSSPSDTDPSVALRLVAYEYPPASGANYTVSYRILRSSAGSATLLQLVTELTQTQFEALEGDYAWADSTDYVAGQVVTNVDVWYRCILAHTSGDEDDEPGEGEDWEDYWVELDGPTYWDTADDDSLDASVTVNLADPMTGFRPPPALCVRAWRGRLVLGGTAEYTAGSITVQVGSEDTAVINSPGNMRLYDVGARLVIEDEARVFTITAVNTSGGSPVSYTLDAECSGAHSADAYVLYWDGPAVYLTDPLPENIEGYAAGNLVYANDGHGNRTVGIAESAGNLLVLRRDRVDLLEGAEQDWQLLPVPGGPPGCVSHRTIADKDAPAVFWYAGKRGIWALVGGEAQEIGAPLRSILEDTVDHDYDDWTHGVWDAELQMYHLWLFQAGDVLEDGRSGLIYRVPSLMLSFDWKRKHWEASWLPASASGIWVDEYNKPYVVMGTVSRVRRLDQTVAYDDKGALESSATVAVPWFTGPVGGMAPGSTGAIGLTLSVRFEDGTYHSYSIRTNPSAVEGGVDVYAESEGGTQYTRPVWLGGICWYAETGELLTDDPTVRKKVERVTVVTDERTSNEPVVVTARTRDAGSGPDTQSVENSESGMTRVEMAGADAGLRGTSAVLRIEGGGIGGALVLAAKVVHQDVAKR